MARLYMRVKSDTRKTTSGIAGREMQKVFLMWGSAHHSRYVASVTVYWLREDDRPEIQVTIHDDVDYKVQDVHDNILAERTIE